MAYDIVLSDRVREALAHLPIVEEKLMFGGICYMVDGTMCVGVLRDEMMCRIDPAIYEEALEKEGCREMNHSGKSMKGFVFVNEAGLKTKKQFDYWIQLCLSFNKQAKASKKKRSK